MHEKQLQLAAEGVETEHDKISAFTRLERQSELIWKDRSNRVNEKIRLENLMVGRIGNFAFDTDI
jgi:hypothetical protein